MDKIYSAVDRVLIWLGGPEDESDIVMGCIPVINQTAAGVKDLRSINLDNLKYFGLPSREEPLLANAQLAVAVQGSAGQSFQCLLYSDSNAGLYSIEYSELSFIFNL